MLLFLLFLASEWTTILVPAGGGAWQAQYRGRALTTEGPARAAAPVTVAVVVDLARGSPAEHACLMQEVAGARDTIRLRGDVGVGAFDPPAFRLGQSPVQPRYRHFPIGGGSGMVWNANGGPRCGDEVEGKKPEGRPLGQVNALAMLASLRRPGKPLAVIWVGREFEDWTDVLAWTGRDASPATILDLASAAGMMVIPVVVGGNREALERAGRAAALFAGRAFAASGRPGDTMRAALNHIDSLELLRLRDEATAAPPRKIETWLELRSAQGTKLRRVWYLGPGAGRRPVGLPGVLSGVSNIVGVMDAPPDARGCPAEQGVNRFLALRIPVELRARLRAPLRAEFDYLRDDAKLDDEGPFLSWGATAPVRMEFKLEAGANAPLCLPVRAPFPGRRYRVVLLDGSGDWAVVAEGRFPQQETAQ